MTRPTGFSQDIADQVLDRIAEGEMLTKVCEQDGMPTKKQFRYWLTTHTELQAAYARARLAWADHWAERVVDISFNPQGGAIDAQGNTILDHATIALLKLQTDNVKWLVGKWAPRTYGERPDDQAAAGQAPITRIERVIIGADPPQLQYHPPAMPGDLTERDWLALRDVLELLKRTVPTNDERPPAEIFDVIRQALLAHFSSEADASSAR